MRRYGGAYTLAIVLVAFDHWRTRSLATGWVKGIAPTPRKYW